MEDTSLNKPAGGTPLERSGISPLKYVPGFLKNKFFVAFAAFAVVMLFLDKNDLFTQMARKKELNEMLQSKLYYTKQISELRQRTDGILHDPRTIEKYSRENFLMKKENEDLFLVPENYDTPK